jgi:hypothetical protein
MREKREGEVLGGRFALPRDAAMTDWRQCGAHIRRQHAHIVFARFYVSRFA